MRDGDSDPKIGSGSQDSGNSRTEKLLAELDEQIIRARRELAAMWCRLDDARSRRSRPPVKTQTAPAATSGFTATDGAAALSHVRDHGPPAVLVLDLMMPGMSGDRLLARLRAIADADRTAVMFFTAASESLVSATGFDPATVIPKPRVGPLLERLSGAVAAGGKGSS
jgi:CheY-like chemotaxis protein